ncbi:50S ribosomal protein L13 [Enterococcus sp. AZ020]|uniref:Large ribosomal subunit protein uL13 n=2 Tax=Enterococcus TaxID=1350 RepID=A0A200J7S2_9ENTE|nr:50S ribosomal protein L13 [Enterococcus sp. 9D6_DIV0238]
MLNGIVCPTMSPGNSSVCQTSNRKLEEKNVRTTYMAKTGEVERKWYVVDATDVPLGRLSAVVASILRGKNKPTFTPHVDTGDFVIVINADQVKLTGNKATDKIYYRHSQYPGGLKSVTAGELRDKNSRRLIENSIKGMLPKNTLGRKQLTKLNVYGGAEHPHAAQQPEVLDITNLI